MKVTNKNVLYTYYFGHPLRIWLAFFLIIITFLGTVLFGSYTSSGPPTTSGIVSRGLYLIVLRLPPKVSKLQEDVIIFGDGSQSHEMRVIRGPSDPTHDDISMRAYTQRMLTPDEWKTLDGIRLAWCQRSPPLHVVRDGESFYDIAMRCSTNNSSKHFMVATNHLPHEFVTFINHVPSSQEIDLAYSQLVATPPANCNPRHWSTCARAGRIAIAQHC